MSLQAVCFWFVCCLLLFYFLSRRSKGQLCPVAYINSPRGEGRETVGALAGATAHLHAEKPHAPSQAEYIRMW